HPPVNGVPARLQHPPSCVRRQVMPRRHDALPPVDHRARGKAAHIFLRAPSATPSAMVVRAPARILRGVVGGYEMAYCYSMVEHTVAAQLLVRLGVPIERVRREIARQSKAGASAAAQELTLTDASKRVIDLAYEA